MWLGDGGQKTARGAGEQGFASSDPFKLMVSAFHELAVAGAIVVVGYPGVCRGPRRIF